MTNKIGERRVCEACGTQVIVMKEGSEPFAVTCCGAELVSTVATQTGGARS